MQITKIEKTGKKCRLYLNDAPAFCLYPSEVRKLGLREGDELPEETREKIFKELLDKRAKKRSLLLLQKGDMTRRQLEDKLRGDGYPEETAMSALSYVESFGYIDDLRYAVSYIESTGVSRSRRRIVSDLMAKGIARDILDEAFSRAEEVDEEAQIRTLMRKRRFDPETAGRPERDKLIRYLQGKGYSFDTIRRVLEE